MLSKNPYIFSITVFLLVFVLSFLFIFIFRLLKKYFDELNYIPETPLKEQSLLIAFAISWSFAFTLGCVYAGFPSIAINERNLDLLDFKTALMMMLIPPVGLVVSTFFAILITPLARWTLRSGTKNIFIYGSILWIVIAFFITLSELLSENNMDGISFWGSIFISIVGLITIGLIPPKSTISKTGLFSSASNDELTEKHRFKKKLFILLVPLLIGATFCLTYINNKIPDDENSLIELMGSNNDGISFPAAHKLLLKGKEPFFRALKNKNPSVRAVAAHFLMDFPGKDVQSVLMTTANDSDPYVRLWSAYALGVIGDNDALVTLKKLSVDQMDFVRLDAVEALEKIHKRSGN